MHHGSFHLYSTLTIEYTGRDQVSVYSRIIAIYIYIYGVSTAPAAGGTLL